MKTFGLIGHQESWQQAEQLFQLLRPAETSPFNRDEFRALFPFVPPRKLFEIRIESATTGKQVSGFYIETFISPGELTAGFLRKNTGKVKSAAQLCIREGAAITSLGGFSSIVLEGQTDSLSVPGHLFTTGNTLTAAFIVHSVEAAQAFAGNKLSDCNLLIVGATGDLGTACANWFSGKVKQLLLCARNKSKLTSFANTFSGSQEIIASTELKELLPLADVIICVASTAGIEVNPEQFRKGALVCDAGYPKNFGGENLPAHVRYYFGGLGRVEGTVTFHPREYAEVYPFLHHNAGHGCLLESVVMALEENMPAPPQGRGNITPEAIRTLWQCALRNGIYPAAFLGPNGLWQPQPQPEWSKK